MRKWMSKSVEKESELDSERAMSGLYNLYLKAEAAAVTIFQSALSKPTLMIDCARGNGSAD